MDIYFKENTGIEFKEGVNASYFTFKDIRFDNEAMTATVAVHLWADKDLAIKQDKFRVARSVTIPFTLEDNQATIIAEVMSNEYKMNCEGIMLDLRDAKKI